MLARHEEVVMLVVLVPDLLMPNPKSSEWTLPGQRRVAREEENEGVRVLEKEMTSPRRPGLGKWQVPSSQGEGWVPGESTTDLPAHAVGWPSLRDSVRFSVGRVKVARLDVPIECAGRRRVVPRFPEDDSRWYCVGSADEVVFGFPGECGALFHCGSNSCFNFR